MQGRKSRYYYKNIDDFEGGPTFLGGRFFAPKWSPGGSLGERFWGQNGRQKVILKRQKKTKMLTCVGDIFDRFPECAGALGGIKRGECKTGGGIDIAELRILNFVKPLKLLSDTPGAPPTGGGRRI